MKNISSIQLRCKSFPYSVTTVFLLSLFLVVPSGFSQEERPEAKTLQSHEAYKTPDPTGPEKWSQRLGRSREMKGYGPIVGQTVINNRGESIGEVSDVLVREDGRDVQVVLSLGGFLGIGDSEVVVPLSNIKITPRRDYVTYTGQRGGLRKQNNYWDPDENEEPAQRQRQQRMTARRRQNLPDEARDYWYPEEEDDRNRDRFYERPYPGTAEGESYPYQWEEYARYDEMPPYHPPYGETARNYYDPDNPRRPSRMPELDKMDLRLTDLIGWDVRNDEDEEIGEVEDLILQQNGEVMTILSVGGFLGVGEKMIRVPLSRLEITGTEDHLIYPASLKDIRKQEAFQYENRQPMDRETDAGMRSRSAAGQQQETERILPEQGP